MRDLIETISIVAGTIFVALAAILGGVYVLTSWACNTHAQVSGQETQVAALTCYVKQDGKWMTWEEYKLRFATRGTN